VSTNQIAADTPATKASLPWKRYWVVTGEKFETTGGEGAGLLITPSDSVFGLNRHLRTLDQVFQERAGCTILWGDPGMGKTHALSAARPSFGPSSDSNWISLAFRQIPDSWSFASRTMDTDEWKKWRDSTGLMTFVIDGVDEGLVKIPGFVSSLTGLLQKQPTSRLRLVLSCRRKEWPDAEGEALQRLWPEANRRAFELCPLTRDDVEMAASAGGVDPGGFMEGLGRNHLLDLAARPITLFMLLREFQKGQGFSKSRRELYKSHCRQLCEEHDLGRVTSLLHSSSPILHVTAEEKLRASREIAVVLILGGKSTIYNGPIADAATSDLKTGDLSAQIENADQTKAQLNEPIVEATLRTPLFSQVSASRVAIAHQTFAECLAAEQLESWPLSQLITMFFRSDSSGLFVEPPLAETAAWLAGEHPGFRDLVLKNDPETLLRSDVADTDDAFKMALVFAILGKARSAELFDMYGIDRFFSTLSHPGLTAQLRPILNDRRANIIARRIALRIAERCRLSALLPDVLALLEKDTEDPLRTFLTGAIDDLSTKADADTILRIAVGSSLGHADKEVRYAAMRTLLLLGVWRIQDALKLLPEVVGKHRSDTHSLVRFIESDDVIPILKESVNWKGSVDRLHPLWPLIFEATKRGLDRFNEPEIRQAMASHWLATAKPYGRQGRGRDDPFAQIQTGPADRRRLFIATIADLKDLDNGSVHLVNEAFIRSEDFDFLLDQVAASAGRRQELMAGFASERFVYGMPAASIDKLLGLLLSVPCLQRAFHWMRVYSLDDPATQQIKENHRKHEAHVRDLLDHRADEELPAPSVVWLRDVDHLSDDATWSWVRLTGNLSYDGQHRVVHSGEHDLQNTPGWVFHSATARQKIVQAAEAFLVRTKGDPLQTYGRYTNLSEPAYQACYLLRDRIETTPALRRAVRAYWLPAIIGAFSNGEFHHQEMIALAMRIDPIRVQNELRCLVFTYSKKEKGNCYELRNFTQAWNPNFGASFAAWCGRTLNNPNTLHDVMFSMATIDASAARRLARAVLRCTAPRPTFALRAAVLDPWARHRLFNEWKIIWPYIESSDALARRIFYSLRHDDLEHVFLPTAQAADPDQVARVCIRLHHLFPISKDPKFGAALTPRMDVARFRQSVEMTLVARASRPAVPALQRVASSVPKRDRIWIRWRYIEALKASRRREWNPAPVAALRRLIAQKNSRWISDEFALQSLILESLDQFQRDITGSTNSSRMDFWDPPSGKGVARRFRPKAERALAREAVKWLKRNLDSTKGITIQCEVEIQPGERTDFEVRTVTTAASGLRPITVIVEVKGSWNRDVKKAWQSQLIDRYLTNAGLTHGIYLVFWHLSRKWNDSHDHRRKRVPWGSLEDAQKDLDDATRVARDPFVVVPRILDCRLR